MYTAMRDIVVPNQTVEGLDIEAGQTLVSVEGLVWVTTSNTGADIILGPGDSIVFPKRGRAVVGGLRQKGVTVRIDPPRTH